MQARRSTLPISEKVSGADYGEALRLGEQDFFESAEILLITAGPHHPINRDFVR